MRLSKINQKFKTPYPITATAPKVDVTAKKQRGGTHLHARYRARRLPRARWRRSCRHRDFSTSRAVGLGIIFPQPRVLAQRKANHGDPLRRHMSHAALNRDIARATFTAMPHFRPQTLRTLTFQSASDGWKRGPLQEHDV